DGARVPAARRASPHRPDAPAFGLSGAAREGGAMAAPLPAAGACGGGRGAVHADERPLRSRRHAAARDRAAGVDGAHAARAAGPAVAAAAAQATGSPPMTAPASQSSFTVD